MVPANTLHSNRVGSDLVREPCACFVDCTGDTWEIDPDKIEEKITKKRKQSLESIYMDSLSSIIR